MWGYFIFPIIFGGGGWRALRDASKDTSHRLEEFYPSPRWAPPLKQGRSWRGKKLSLYFRGTSEAEGVNTPRNEGIILLATAKTRQMNFRKKGAAQTEG
jgi:hypothetical protein